MPSELHMAITAHKLPPIPLPSVKHGDDNDDDDDVAIAATAAVAMKEVVYKNLRETSWS